MLFSREETKNTLSSLLWLLSEPFLAGVAFLVRLCLLVYFCFWKKKNMVKGLSAFLQSSLVPSCKFPLKKETT
ncbi:hypothetical protein Gasu2_57920 [Galdieria sulphuraria]|nr:hypothetical protein Gasu2_57920 [Galdieria sulphuraria]